MSKYYIKHQELTERCAAIDNRLMTMIIHTDECVAYAFPRGGLFAAYLLMANQVPLILTEDPEQADIFIDDVIDSGATRDYWTSLYPDRPFIALVDKTAPNEPLSDEWIVFPWEGKDALKAADDSIVGTLTNRLIDKKVPFFANDNIANYINDREMDALQEEVTKRCDALLRSLLIDVDRDHNTQGTAARMAKMFLREVYSGRYSKQPNITVFPNAKQLDEMYVTGAITVRSACSHHFVPILGSCWVAIIPGDTVIGLSKINRLVNWVSRRPQIQEEMTVQIADAIERLVNPRGLAVVIKATHECMTWRGVQESMDSAMTSSVLRGAFTSRPEARAELFSLIGISK